MSNDTVTRKRRSTQRVNDHTTVSYEWTEQQSREEYEAQKQEWMHPKLLAKYKKEAPELLEDRMETASEGNERSFWDDSN